MPSSIVLAVNCTIMGHVTNIDERCTYVYYDISVATGGRQLGTTAPPNLPPDDLPSSRKSGENVFVEGVCRVGVRNLTHQTPFAPTQISWRRH